MSTAVDEITNEQILLQEVKSGVAWLTLNRPTQFNSLSAELLHILQNTLNTLAQDDTVRVVVIGANGKAFCAGHDLKEMRSTTDREFHQQLFDQCSQVMRTINQMPQPVIAMVQGIATAGGCQLVAACDLAIASEQARLAVSGINLGLFCSTPAVPLSRNVSRKRAMKMLLTGDFIDANTAKEFGLINDVTEPENLSQATAALAANIVAKSPLSVRLGKEMFYKQLEMGLSAAYDFAATTMVCNLENEDTREGIDAFIEKRQPVRRGK
ncbi:MAG: enoyl-CoA hydratase [Gammaproteobacteria bacterium]